MPSRFAIAVAAAALALLVCAPLATGCEDVPATQADGGAYDAPRPPDVWDPGPKPTGPCSYGYGENCPAAAVDCNLNPCAHGTCLRGDAGVDSCICDAGYAGLLCTECAPGYVPSGLVCVASDPCVGGPCVFGTCYAQGASFYCECDTGYAGTRCDACAPGYHPAGLQCVPD